MPPPAEQLASRIFLGPALRAQSDRRLVRLVREGYETAFEEIVRRYRKPLDRFAAAIVGGRSEDVTQDAFSKALLALRGSDNEIELRPWLYRIVRNTALNDLRDGPPAAEELGETLEGGRSAAAEAERREEIAELMERLRALPEPQRAAIVMRELEGLSHAEIAAALGMTGGAARQTIHRARVALRDGLGMLIPLPLLRMLFDHGAEAAGAGGAVAAAGTAAGASGGAGAVLGGLGAGGAIKVGVATALIAGSVGAGVAIQHDRGGHGGPQPAAAAVRTAPAGAASESLSGGSDSSGSSDPAPQIGASESRGSDGRSSESGDGDDHGGRPESSDGISGGGGGFAEPPPSGSGPAPSGGDDGQGGRGGHGPGRGGPPPPHEDLGGGGEGQGAPHGPRGIPGGGEGGGGTSGSGGGGGSGSGGQGGGHSPGGQSPAIPPPPPPTEPPPQDHSGDIQPNSDGASGGSGEIGL